MEQDQTILRRVGVIVLLSLFGFFCLLFTLWLGMRLLFSFPEMDPHPHSELLQSGELVGLSEAEVIARVGLPAHRGYRTWYDMGPWDDFVGLVIYYELDLGRSILMIHFDYDTREVEEAVARRLPSTFPDEPFSAEIWKSSSPEARRGMLRSLLNEARLRGRTDEEVFELLGPPTGSFRELVYEDGSNDWLDPILGIHLVLDEEDTVTEQYTTDY